jgi:hypothetical protein
LKTIEQTNEHKEILLGCIPRSGKTFIMAGIIYLIDGPIRNFLIMTTCPNETIKQYMDVFESYMEFNDFSIVYIKNATKPASNGTLLHLKDKNIIICSQQFIKTNQKAGIKKIKWLMDLDIDIIFSDEAHYGGTSDLSKKIISTYKNDDTICVYITATYGKPVNTFNIRSDAHILWDLEDVKLCKEVITDDDALERLKEKHGDADINELLTTHSIYDIEKCYEKYPQFHIITWKFIYFVYINQ